MVLKIQVDASRAKARLALARGRLGTMQQDLMAAIGAEMERAMKLQVSSGKNKAVDTGRLRSNINFQLLGSGRSTVLITGVDKTIVYAKRIALGFTGTDSLGRSFDQRARPFHTDAWEDDVRPRLESIARRVVEKNTQDLR